MKKLIKTFKSFDYSCGYPFRFKLKGIVKIDKYNEYGFIRVWLFLPKGVLGTFKIYF